MKTCFKCGSRKNISEFYRHPQMGDGHLGKCKDCTKKDVRERYSLTIEERHEYDRRRYQEPARHADTVKQHKVARLRHPDKYRARYAVSNAIRDGRLMRGPCEKCGTTRRVQAHHHDYSKPIDVEWLCFVCHRRHAHGQKPSERRTA